MRTNAEIEQVVEKYASTLLRVAFSQMQNRADAEDMVQDAFLKYVEKSPEFTSSEHEKAWLIRVTVNLCRNRLATAWFRKSAPLSEDLPALDPEETGLLDAISALPAKYRIVIHLYYYEGYSISEISELLGRKLPTVSSQLSRARKLLASSLKEGC